MIRLLVLGWVFGGCASQEAFRPETADASVAPAEEMVVARKPRSSARPRPSPAPPKAGVQIIQGSSKKEVSFGSTGRGYGGGGLADEGAVGGLLGAPVMDGDADGKPEPEPAAMRTWFPEAFLWRPSVVTDAFGKAVVDVRVPDQLTDWRVLALAHDHRGQQSGAVHSFASVLPVSVDPIVPTWLYVGDEVVVPTQVSALSSPFEGSLTVRSSGVVSGSGGGSVSVSRGGTQLLNTVVTAEESGLGSLQAEVFKGQRIDGAERPINVRPVGRPVRQSTGGGLGGARTFTLATPGSIEETLSVRVFPGPLALYQAELQRLSERPSGATPYVVLRGFQALAGQASIKIDENRLRTVRIRAWQSLVKESRQAAGAQLLSFVHGLQGVDDPLVVATRERLTDQLVSSQRGDGTWSTRSSSNVQQVLVQTAASARSLPESKPNSRRKAAGALERLAPNVDDAYTAAWLLASGLMSDSQRPALEALVLKGIAEEPDGRHRLNRVSSVMSPTFSAPSRAEHLAVTWLALEGRDDLPWKSDLLAELLQGWSPVGGLGGEWADTIILEVLQRGMPALSQPTAILLEKDGNVVGRAQLDPAQPLVPAVLEASLGGTVSLRSDPVVPGLSFSATHTAYVPFTGAESLPGVEVETSIGRLTAGRPGRVTLTVSAPSGADVELEFGLPVGATAELASSQQVASHNVLQDRVTLTTNRFKAGQIQRIELDVTPMYAGRMTTRPLHVASGSQSADLRPAVWTVAR